MADDEAFEPKLGRIGARDRRRTRKYLHLVLAAANLAGKRRAPSAFRGNRIGRGSGVGRLLASRGAGSVLLRRRVIIKSRIVRLTAKGLAGARAHMRYLKRDGVTREGQPGQLYDAARDIADGDAFHARSGGDRHQFRLIVSAEDGAAYDDLKPLTRRLMARVEEDLGTRLDWVAVDHFNTGHPHTHILLRGIDERGRDLVIARDYLARGMRERAAELVELDLGPRSEREVEQGLRAEIEAERLTSLDRQLIADIGDDGLVAPSAADPVRHARLAGRLGKLGRLGLAEPVGGGRWRLAGGLEDTLRQLAVQGDIIKALHHELARTGRTAAIGNIALYDPHAPEPAPLVGRVAARGISDELADRRYLLIEALDGRTYHVDVGRVPDIDMPLDGAIVRVTARPSEARASDRRVAEIAAANGGRYSIDLHRAHDPHASEAFATAHVRRLEALRRVGAGPERAPDGSWRIRRDHVARAAAYERTVRRDRPVEIETLSDRPLARLTRLEGAGWLDRVLAAGQEIPVGESGFARELRAALAQRRAWLIARNLGGMESGRFVARSDMLARLEACALDATGARLAEELSRPYRAVSAGERIEGRYARAVNIDGRRYALIERAKDFTLVPWRPVLEKRLGQYVERQLRGGSISWSFGRDRGPSI